MRVIFSILFISISFVAYCQQYVFGEKLQEEEKFEILFKDLFSDSMHAGLASTLKMSSSIRCLEAGDYLPGIFCRMEHKLEKASKMAPRFRLGSLSYTEWMEGKRKWNCN